MELVDERQISPLVLTVVFLFIVVAGSYGLVHILNPSQLTVNRYFWYMERAAGLTAYQLLSLTVILGLTVRSSVWDRLRARKVMTQVHQFASLLVLPFIALHLWGIHQDSSVPFTWLQVFVPLQSSYRTLATSLGTLSLYGVLVIVISSYLRPKISVNTWRAIHYASFPVFILVTAHGLWSGTDSTAPWAMWFYMVPALTFLALVIKRFDRRTVR